MGAIPDSSAQISGFWLVSQTDEGGPKSNFFKTFYILELYLNHYIFFSLKK